MRMHSLLTIARLKSLRSRHRAGPGNYNMRSACGVQVASTQRSASAAAFGQPSVSNTGRGILPLEGRHSPGPIYMNAAACKKQGLSTKRSAPHMVFSRANRFPHMAGGANVASPGPGEYIV